MKMLNCPNCQRRTGFKRALGFGTLFMVVLTCGFWLLVIPFYPSRCIVCGITEGASARATTKEFFNELGKKELSRPQILIASFSIIAVVLILMILNIK